MEIDTTKEEKKQVFCNSLNYGLMWARGRNFDGKAIKLKLRSRDIVFAKGKNTRISRFWVQVEPTGERNLFFRYLLDSRLSKVTEDATFLEDLSGEAIGLGFIRIANQSQRINRILPRINYSRGESIIFELYDDTLDMELSLLGIGMDVIAKVEKKGKKVSQ